MAKPKKKKPVQMDMFPSAKAARDESLWRVMHNAGDWQTKAWCRLMLEIGRFPGIELTGEELRFRVEPDLPAPHHHNVWGPLVLLLVRAGQLTPLNKFRHMTGPRSNARMTRVYLLTPREAM